MTTIITKNGSGAPTAGQLTTGELAVDLTNKELYTKDSGGNVIKVGAQGGSTGTFTDLTATSSFTSPGIDDNATSTAITIDANENVTVGGTTAGNAGTINVSVGSPGSTVGGLQLWAGTSGSHFMQFGDTASGDGYYRGAIGYLHTSDALVAYSAGTERMRITSSGDVNINGTGSNLLTASGRGILSIDGTSDSGLEFKAGGTTYGYLYASSGEQRLVAYTAIPLTFFTSNTERMRIDASGNLGVGVTNPSERLDVLGVMAITGSTGPLLKMEKNDGSLDSALYYNNSNSTNKLVLGKDSLALGFRTGGTERLSIDSNGRVGIGTTSIESLLTLQGDSPAITVNATNNDKPRLELARDASVFNWRIVNDAAQYKIEVGDDSTSWVEKYQATSGGNHYWNTDEMVLENGNLGIGTAVPTHRLTIGNTSQTTPNYLSFNSTVTNYTANEWGGFLIESNDPSGGGAGVKGSIRAINESNLGGRVGWEFNIANGVSNDTLAMKISSVGNVGIGTASPAGKQHTVLNTSHTWGNAWSAGTAVFGGAGSTNGALGISYNDTDGAVLGAIDPGVAWKPVALYGSEISFSIAGSEKARLDSSGSLLVGTTVRRGQLTTLLNSGSDPVHAVQHYSTANAGWYMLRFFNGAGTAGGSITFNTSTLSTAYNTTSDVRLKENIVDAPAGNIDAIRVRSFDWKADGSHETYGMVAQELAEVAPQAVAQGETEEDMWGVDYSKLVPMMIKEIQDLKAEVAALKGA
jgi:hypothetical protein